MEWLDLCADPVLKDLPYKVELDQWGQIVMSPASVRHVLFQNAIAEQLRALVSEGKALLELPIQTADNIKVPDVVWLSQERYQQIKHSAVSPIAPELCVEVMSPANTRAQMNHKRDLYFAAGALEFWVCDEAGEVAFYDATGLLGQSRLIPAFPRRIELD